MKKLIAILLLCLLATGGFAQEKMRIAILDLAAMRVDPGVALMVSDLLRTELFNTGLFIVVERGEMDRILTEQGLQASGCTDTACAVEMGKLLAASKILVGTVGTLGQTYIINARIVDVERGTMEFAAKAEAKGEDRLPRAVENFANDLAIRMRRAAAEKAREAAKTAAPTKTKTRSASREPRKPREPRTRSPHRKLGIILGCSGIALGGFGAVEQIVVLPGTRDDFTTLETEYDALESDYQAAGGAAASVLAAARETLDAKYVEMQDNHSKQNLATALYLSGYGIGGALVATGVVMMLLPAKSQVTMQAAPGSISLSYAF